MSWHRKKFLTHTGVQLRLAMVFVFWSIVLMITLVGLYFVNYASVSTDTGSMQIHDQLLTKMLLVTQAKNLGLYYGGAMLLFILLIGLYVIIYSHRIVGPVYKMNMILDQAIREKQWPKPVKFRKNDAFHEFAKKFNEFVDLMKNN